MKSKERPLRQRPFRQKHRDAIDMLYERKEPIESLGALYEHPVDGFVPHEETLVATVIGLNDGKTVEVFETRSPATFYELRIKETGMIASTGSGRELGELIGQMAIQIAAGMLGLHLDRKFLSKVEIESALNIKG